MNFKLKKIWKCEVKLLIIYFCCILVPITTGSRLTQRCFFEKLRIKLGLPSNCNGSENKTEPNVNSTSIDYSFHSKENTFKQEDRKSPLEKSNLSERQEGYFLIETKGSDVAQLRRKRDVDASHYPADDYEEDYSDENVFDAGSAIDIKTDMFAGLKEKLGISSGNEAYRSSDNNEVEKKLNSLVISSLLTTKFLRSEPIALCFPSSLEEWRKKKKHSEERKGRKPIRYSGKEGSTCDVDIPDLSEKANISSWDSLNLQIKEDSEVFGKFRKGNRPASLSVKFRKAATKLAEKYLINEKKYDNFLTKVAFFKEHPDVNEYLLEYSVTIATLARKDCSPHIPNPIEVDNVFFHKHPKTIDDSEKDYSLFMPEGTHDTTGFETSIQLSSDPEEAKLDYHREDSLFHAFHALFHRIFDSMIQRKYARAFELFFYTHQQMMRRYMIEREVLGMKQVVPLNPPQFRLPLGPGYRAGWYAWEGLGGRIDNCEVAAFNESFVAVIDQKFAEVQAQMSKSLELEEFASFLEKRYHSRGHNIIAMACSAIYDPVEDTGVGVMSFSEASARDPIFYRWHSHIEDIVQQFKDTQTLYQESDFALYDGVEVKSVNTVMSKNLAKTEEDVRNLLITHWEQKKIQHDQVSSIVYNRLNHLDFKYEILVRNKHKVKRKVFVRIWLGVLRDKADMSSYQSKHMIEMDQFAHTLSGEETEIIERLSKQSVATMKDIGSTITSLMEDIEGRKPTETWCGYPHNLLLPRSTFYNPEEKDLGAKMFVLMAFVTNTRDDVTAGSDGIEHLLCGHKNSDTKLDGKDFGFPFDRQLQFKMTQNHSFVSMQGIQIVYRPEDNNPEHMGIHINEWQNKKREKATTGEIREGKTTAEIREETTTEEIREGKTTPEIREESTTDEVIEATITEEIKEETTIKEIKTDPTTEDIRDQATTEKNADKKKRRSFEEKITRTRKPVNPDKILFEHDVFEHTTEGTNRNWNDVWKSLLKMLEDHPELIKDWL